VIDLSDCPRDLLIIFRRSDVGDFAAALTARLQLHLPAVRVDMLSQEEEKQEEATAVLDAAWLLQAVAPLQSCHSVCFVLSSHVLESARCVALLREARLTGRPLCVLKFCGSHWGAPTDPSGLREFPLESEMPAEVRDVLLLQKAIDHDPHFMDDVAVKVQRRVLKHVRGPTDDDLHIVQQMSTHMQKANKNARFDAFLSHRRLDTQDFARALRESLLQNGFSCFLV
jgi:hypothetical protein